MRGSQQELVDMIGIVTASGGDALHSRDIAGRPGGFTDVEQMEQSGVEDGQIIETLSKSPCTLARNVARITKSTNRGQVRRSCLIPRRISFIKAGSDRIASVFFQPSN